MNHAEKRLSKLLRDIVPEPPVNLSAETLASGGEVGGARIASAGRRRLIAPIGAALVVVAVAGGISIASTMSNHGNGRRGAAAVSSSGLGVLPSKTPPLPTGSNGPSTTTSSISAFPTSQGPEPIGPWNAALTLKQTLVGTQQWLTAGPTAGYGLTASSIIRLDPASGSVTASASTTDLGSEPTFKFADGAVWVAAVDAAQNVIRVRELDANDLSAKANLTVPIDGSPDHVAIAEDLSGNSLFVGAGDVVATIDVKSATVVGQFTASPGQVGALALDAGGALYLAMDNDSGTVALQRRDPGSGAVLSSVAYGNWIDEIVATSGGVWLSSHGGTEASIGFYPNGNFNDPPLTSFTSVSSPTPTVSVVQGIAWIGTSSGITCANPDTGTVKANGRLSTAGTFSDISATDDDEWFAYYSGNAGQGVATFTPPSECTR